MGSERNPYRDAYVSAHAELEQIIEQFAQLNARKERVESAVEALRLLVEGGGQVIPINQPTRVAQVEAPREIAAPASVPAPAQAEMRAAAAQSQSETRPVAAQQSTDESAESLEKRIASALGRVAFA